MNEQIRFYIDTNNLEFIKEIKKDKSLSFVLNIIIRSYMELYNEKQIQISTKINENPQKS